MKSRFYLFILAVAAMAGCQNEKFQMSDTSDFDLKFTGTTESYSPETRTALDSDMNVVWKQGDQLSIFVGKTLNQQFQVQNSCDGKIDGAFDPVSTPGFVSSTAIQNNVGYYPYSSSTTLLQDDQYYLINTTLPSQQSYASNSFGSGAFPMVAVTEDTYDTNLKFKNVLGGIKLQLKGTAKIKSIKISGNNDEYLGGPARINVGYNALPAICILWGGTKTVTLNCGSGVQLNPDYATDFIIALPPVTFSKGFTVIIIDTDDKAMEVSTNKERTVNRSSIMKMSEISYVGQKDYKPLTFTSNGQTTISLEKDGTPYDIFLEYKLNNGTWTPYSIGTSFSLNDKDQLSFQASDGGNQAFSKWSLSDYYFFKMSGSGTISASGNIMSLVDQKMKSVTIPYEDYFCKLFYNCTSLTTAPDLPATTLTAECYLSMFEGCTSLITPPVLPATNIERYCYQYMFSGCTSLTSTPVLSGIVLDNHCYEGMFLGCTTLTTAPKLPATTLAASCYESMFRGCTSLATAPELPATNIVQHCYTEMFSGCTSLTTAPKLPAFTLELGCYAWMLSGCTSLTAAPELPATNLAQNCYSGMFFGCTSLTSAPKLPALTLVPVCYQSMFSGCTSLTAAPDLPALTLVQDCYSQMFYGCSKLNHVKALFTTTPSETYNYNWLSGVSSTGTFVKSKDATWNVTGTNGIPNGWTVKIDPKSGREYVDLGLSVKWATMNVGATKSTDYGDYFAWGATEPLYELGYAQEDPQSHWKTGKSAGYTFINTPYQTANTASWSSTKWTKYLGSITSSYKDASATDVNALKTVLDSIDDAASVNWGGSWRMPTKEEQNELLNTDNCTWTWYDSGNTEFNGVAGYKVTSNKSGYTDKFIFLPAAGFRNVTYLFSVGSNGTYWSSSLSNDYPDDAFFFFILSSQQMVYNSDRSTGRSVRPVCP